MTPAPGPTLTIHRWDTAWLAAFEAAAADPAQLLVGERLLATATMKQVNINAGMAKTTLTEPNARTSVQPRLTITVIDRPDWKQAYKALAARDDLAEVINAGHLPDILTDPAATGGIQIVPDPGDFTFTCSCRPGPGICPHTAAVGYSLAQHLRANPGILVTLRGGSMKHLKTTVRLRKPSAPPQPDAPARPPHARSPQSGTDAHHAFHRWKNRPTTPAAAPVPPIDTHVPPLGVRQAEPPAPGPARDALRLLVQDAARRASALLAGDPTHITHELLPDTARLLTHPANLSYLEHAAAYLGLSTLQVKQLALAYEHGGPTNVYVTAHPLPADPKALAHAESAIQPLRPSPLATLNSENNHLTDTAARVQLRLAPNGRWYPFTDWHGTWRPAPGHSTDPVAAYRAARRALRDQRR